MITTRIMTYNVQRCRGPDGQTNIDRVLHTIADAAPDIVALQDLGTVNNADILAYLAKQLGSKAYRDMAGGEQVFISHIPLRGIQKYSLGYAGSCLRADVDLGGRRLHLLNVCLDTFPRFRKKQIETLLGPELLGNPSMASPVLVLGDFGDFLWGAGNLELGSVLRRVHRPLWRATYPSLYPLFDRDRAYLRGGVRVLDASINRSILARQASKHLPLTLTVQVCNTQRTLPLPRLAGRRMETAPG
jgi:endonuclease/exonuclease/phosphatase family metal-dependent hydrolase